MSTTVAAGIERRLAVEILRGDRPPGSTLPPVRELAHRHGVTPPTVQRAIDRLAAGGLVSARRGSGVTVCDPRRSADLSLLPWWFEALADQPDRAARILGDFLELRRVVLVHLVRTQGRRIAAAAPVLAPQVAAVERARTPDETAAADLAIAWAILGVVDQFAVGAVLQATERLVREVPAVTRAVYGDRAAYRRDVARIAGALVDAGPAAAGVIDRILAAWDRRSVARFRRQPARRLAAHGDRTPAGGSA